VLIKRWLGSLVNRATVLVVGVILVVALTVILVGGLLSQRELEQQAKAQVESIAALVSYELDEKLAMRLNIVSQVANNLTMTELVFRDRAELLLSRQTELLGLFDGLFILDAEGRLQAENPSIGLPKGMDFSAREYFERISTLMTPVISEPYVSSYEGKPGIMIGAPVFNHNQRFIGIIGGVMLLEGDHILKKFGNIRFAQTGYIGIATRSGTTLVNGRNGQFMVPLRAENPVLMNAMEGFEGTSKTDNGDGDATIMSVRQLDQAPWFVAAIWPTKEAFAPIGRMARGLGWTLLLILLVLVPIASWRFRILMRPLKLLGQQVQDRHLGLRSQPVAIPGSIEIQRVATIFNTLMVERESAMLSLLEREAFYRSLTQSAPIGIAQTDVLGRIEFANPALEVILGRSAADLINTPMMGYLKNSDRKTLVTGWQRDLYKKKTFHDRIQLAASDGQDGLWVDMMSAVIETDERTLGTITVMRDVTQELAAADAVEEEQRRAQSIIGVLQEGVLMVDNTGAVRYANSAALQLLGIPEIIEPANFFALASINYEGCHYTLEKFQASQEIDNLYATLRNHAGDEFDVDLTMLKVRNSESEERLVFVLRDDSARRRENERLSWEASHDPLTQLLNRRAFGQNLDKALTEAGQHKVATVMLLIDLDHFKPVNDKGGHITGDELLRRLADLLRQIVRQSDTVARLGGDEFGVLLPSCGMERAKALAEQIRAGIETLTVDHQSDVFSVTASIGLTRIDATDVSAKAIMARADEGTYLAKGGGRNQVVTVLAPDV
jgi:diguanylate cyclase (GGDEF)-like protein/PAS domain S-box-containing protein